MRNFGISSGVRDIQGVDKKIRQADLPFDDKQQSDEEMAAENQAMKVQISSLRSEVTSLETQKTTLETSLATANATISSANEQISTLNSEKAELVTEKATLESYLATANASLDTANAQISTLTDEKANLESEKATLESEKAEIEAEKTAIQKELTSTQKDLTTYQGFIENPIPTYDDPTKAKSALSKNGVIKLDCDVANTSSFANGVISSVNRVIYLNGHTITTARQAGSFLLRGSERMVIDGPGTVKNLAEGFSVMWTSNAKNVLIINGGDYVNTNHSEVIYSEKGTIYINGGTFRCTGDDSRYLLNCYDANYQAGTANIIVKGGKFYDFDPGNNAAEGPSTSYLAEGYVSVQREDEEIDGKTYQVYEVVKQS